MAQIFSGFLPVEAQETDGPPISESSRGVPHAPLSKVSEAADPNAQVKRKISPEHYGLREPVSPKQPPIDHGSTLQPAPNVQFPPVRRTRALPASLVAIPAPQVVRTTPAQGW